MEQKKVRMDCKVLTEKISPDNVAEMAELIAMRETRALIGYMGYHAEKAHKQLCRDIFGKHQPEYTFSDSYDLVQSVALFLCGHYGIFASYFFLANLIGLCYNSTKRRYRRDRWVLISENG